MTSQVHLKGLEHELEFFPKFKPTLSAKASALSFYTSQSEHSRRQSTVSDTTMTEIDHGSSYPYFEVSAATGTEVGSPFYHAALHVQTPSAQHSQFRSIAIDNVREGAPRGAQLFADNGNSRCCF